MHMTYNDISFSIDKESPVPLYYQIKLSLKEAIDDNLFDQGEPILSERELCEYFDVSRTTIRQAIRELVNEGVLKKVKGKGTFVQSPKFNYGSIQDIVTYYDWLIKKGFTPKTKILNVDIIEPNKIISENLNISREERVIKIRRLRIINQDPIVIITNYLPEKLFPGLENIDLEDKSLYKTISGRYNIELGKSKVMFYPGLADEYDSKLLEQKKNSPIQIIETISLSKEKEPFDFFESRFRGNYGKIFVEIER